MKKLKFELLRQQHLSMLKIIVLDALINDISNTKLLVKICKENHMESLQDLLDAINKELV